MLFLESIYKDIQGNLQNTMTRTQADKSELVFLKKKFAKVFNDMIKENNILNIHIDGVGYLHDLQLSSETSAIVIMNVYNSLNAFFCTKKPLQNSFQNTHSDVLLDVFDENKRARVEPEYDMQLYSSFWDTL
jgi:hypothetical protein